MSQQLRKELLLNLAIPYASSQTAFQIYRAHVIPMPQGDPTEAIKWVTEGSYLAISEDSMETTVLTEKTVRQLFGKLNIPDLPSNYGGHILASRHA